MYLWKYFMKKFLNLIKWLLQLSILLLIIVLMADNMQSVTFNIFNTYIFSLPLIILLLITLIIGIILGRLLGFFINFTRKKSESSNN